jgi:hypothetical protein
MKMKYLKFLIPAGLIVMLFMLCNQSQNKNSDISPQVKTPKLFAAITDVNGKITTTDTIDGDINDRNKIEQFAKNLAKNPGYSYVGGVWENGQFLGVVNTPAGKMFLAIKEAD